MHSAAESSQEICISLAGYGCSSSAGIGKNAFWNGLVEGHDFSAPFTADFPAVCSFPDPAASMRERLVTHLLHSFQEVGFHPRGEYGVIFGSSKGDLEDHVWLPGADLRREDPYTAVMQTFLTRAGLQPRRALTVSNACASAHGAIFLARHWLQQTHLTDVLVLAADGVGPFVLQGFRSLGALSPTRCQPFCATRDGLRLGEAAAALWLTSRPESELRLQGVALETEGYAVTRSSESGQGLATAIRRTGESQPDFVVAHGTGTPANDRVEDRVLSQLFTDVPITATKWSVGHTLGASGLLDTIAASEVLRRRQGFAIANSPTIDPSFRARYWNDINDTSLGLRNPRSAVVTSLGFGGMNAAIRLEVVA